MANFTWEGDFEEANNWRPFGESVITALKSMSGGSVIKQNLIVSAEVSIMAQCNPDTLHIRADGGGYMESGFLDWLALGVKSPNAYKPSIIKFNTFVTQNSRTKDSQIKETYINASSTRAVADGDDSWALGCKTKSESVAVSSALTGGVSEFFSKEPAFCGTDLLIRKLAQGACPSSVFTGKMRAYVQGLYGSIRTDYEGYWSMIGGMLHLKTDEYLLDSNGNVVFDAFGEPKKFSMKLYPYFTDYGYGLVKCDKTWVMIQVTREAVIARKMKAKYKPADKATSNDTRDTSLLEVYELATLVPTTESIKLADISGVTQGWSFRPYGWHFNDAGTNAVVAAYKVTPFTADNVSGVPTQEFGWTCAVGRLSITVGVDKEGALYGRATAEITDEALLAPYGQHAIYYPDLTTGTRMALAIEGNAGTYPSGGSAVVYAYYDENNEEALITANNAPWQVHGTEYNANLDSWYMGNLFGISCVDAGGYHAEGQLSSGGGVKYTSAMITTPEGSFVGSGGSDGILQWSESHLAPSVYCELGYWDDRYNCGQPPGVFGTTRLRTACWYSKGYESYRRDVTKTDHGHSFRPILVIPFGDASAYIAGLAENVTGTFTEGSLRPQGGNILATLDGDPVSLALAGLAWGGGYPLTGFQDVTELNKQFVNHESVTMGLVTRHGAQDLSGYGDSKEQGLVLAYPKNVNSDPFYNFPIAVRTSLNGASWWSFQGTLDIKGRENWPDMSNTDDCGSAVGWA